MRHKLEKVRQTVSRGVHRPGAPTESGIRRAEWQTSNQKSNYPPSRPDFSQSTAGLTPFPLLLCPLGEVETRLQIQASMHQAVCRERV